MSRSGVVVIGHRGAMGHAPENTFASFELGWRLGADAVECDVHLSRDGTLAVIHDESLDRTTSGSGLVKDRPWSYIRKLEAGAWYRRKFRGQRVPRLADLLAWVRDKETRAGRPLRLVVEVKNEPVRYPSVAEAVVRALSAARFLDRALLISFDHGVVKRAKSLCRRLFAGILFHQPLPDVAARVSWTRADGVFPRHSLVTPAFMRRARARKWFVGAWTANEPADMKRLVRLGVDAVATNYPDRLLRLLGR